MDTLYLIKCYNYNNSQLLANGDKNSERNANENEVASIFARANDAESFTSNIEPLSMPSTASRVEETKLLSQKMRVLLSKGVTGLHKVFPEENKNHQVSAIRMVYSK